MADMEDIEDEARNLELILSCLEHDASLDQKKIRGYELTLVSEKLVVIDSKIQRRIGAFILANRMNDKESKIVINVNHIRIITPIYD